MGLFGRKAKGRHALGAAVTSVPSAPLQGYPSPAAAPVPPAPVLAVPVPAAPAPAAPAPVPPVTVPATEPSIMTAIAELIATGEAWATDVDALEELPRLLAAPVEAPAPAVPPQAPAPMPPAPVTATPAVPAPVPLAPAMPAPAPARSSLEAALAELLPSATAGGPAPAPRVQLGFRDGTSATLEPGSDQAVALEELAQTLTRRD